MNNFIVLCIVVTIFAAAIWLFIKFLPVMIFIGSVAIIILAIGYIMPDKFPYIRAIANKILNRRY